MRSLKLLGAAIVVAWGLGSETNESHAQGIHIGAGPVHVDVGNPHGSWYRGNYGGHGYRHRVYNHGHWGGGGGHFWHDTSHYDYHPGGYQRHWNHYHYVPGHYDFHREGHWDHGHH